MVWFREFESGSHWETEGVLAQRRRSQRPSEWRNSDEEEAKRREDELVREIQDMKETDRQANKAQRTIT